MHCVWWIAVYPHRLGVIALRTQAIGFINAGMEDFSHQINSITRYHSTDYYLYAGRAFIREGYI